jgi:hypothetical protein
MSKINFRISTIKRLERKLSDAREAIISMPYAPILSSDGEQVTITKECYNNLVIAINP